MYFSQLPSYWAALWYLLAGFPSICEVILKIALNNVELWEPIHSHPRPDAPIKLARNTPSQSSVFPQRPTLARPNFAEEPLFYHRKARSGLQTWIRIAYFQLTRQTYRILVRPDEPIVLSATIHFLCRLGQLSLFVWGSMTQGGTYFMPSPTDYALCALLVFATATPRLVWPHFWRCGRSGPDLVVWFKPPF